MNSFTLKPAAPFRLDFAVNVLRRSHINEVDRWDGQTYSKVIVIDNIPVLLLLVQTAPQETPEIRVEVSTQGDLRIGEDVIAPILNRLLGLSVDLTDFYNLTQSNSALSRLVKPLVGFKPTRYLSVFEGLLNGIAGQQISLHVAITILNRLAVAYGKEFNGQHAFPRPADLLDASVEDIKKLGFSSRKAEYILYIAQAVNNGDLDLELLDKYDDETAIHSLRQIHGIGRWTAEYVALRGLGRTDIYPADDVGNLNKLQQWLDLQERPDYIGTHKIIDRWSPYRGLLYFLLLLQSMENSNM